VLNYVAEYVDQVEPFLAGKLDDYEIWQLIFSNFKPNLATN
jgi:hypothetical protein